MHDLEHIPSDMKTRLEDAIAMGEDGKLDKAAEVFMALAGEAQNDFDFLIQLARQLEAISRYGKAQEIYARTMKLKPEHYLTYARLGALYVKIEKYPIAIKNLEQAVRLTPDNPDLHYNLALAYQANNDIDNAIVHLEKTLELGGRAHLAFGTLSRIYEQTNQMDKLDAVLSFALEQFPDDSFLNFNAAIAARRKGNHKEALALLDKSLASKEISDSESDPSEINEMKMAAGFEYGRNYDKLGKYDKAYAAFADGNKRAGENLFLKVPDKSQALKNVAKLRALDLSDWEKVIATPLKDSAQTPVFLIGFPRSGTTLLHQVLDGHSMLEVFEEKPVLAAVTTHIENNLGGFPEALKILDQKTLNAFRDEYMKGMKTLQTKSGVVRAVDKLPLNIIKVPLIKKIFPDAKFILALRHPCDCTLSCFMQNFGLNHAMMNFLNLDDATHYYREVFSLWFHYIDQLTIDFITIRYEDVVADLEKEARRVISFLGLPWEDAVLQYREQAQAKKRINTPSYSQVVQPIYKDASGRWKHYEKYLEPYLERLAPLCQKLAYTL